MTKKSKCNDCDEEATEVCNICGEEYCSECAESRQGYCDCEVPPSIHPFEKPSKKKTKKIKSWWASKPSTKRTNTKEKKNG